MPSSSSFSNQIRSVIQHSGISRYRLSKRTGVTQAALCRFMQGQSGLTTETLDRLAPELDLRVEKRTENKTPSNTRRRRGVFFSGEKTILANAHKRRSKKQGKISRF